MPAGKIGRHAIERSNWTALYRAATSMLLGGRSLSKLSPNDSRKLHVEAIREVAPHANRAMRRAVGGERSYGSAGKTMATSVKTKRRTGGKA